MTRSRLLLLGLFLVPFALKIVTSAATSEYGNDGNYYAGIASHVQQGDGLTTRVSLFHHGYRTWPHPSPVYPVWPLALGITAKAVGMDIAAVWLPTLLYFTAIFFAWLWARGLPRVPLFPSLPRGPDTAHATAALIAWNIAIFDKTSRPYTEGLGFTLLFACLWRAPSLWKRRDWLAGAELGAWIGVIFLTRSQLVLVAMAAACAFAWAIVAVADRRRTLTMAAACAAVAAAIVMPHYLHLAEISVRPATGILRFEMAQANDLLSPVHVLTDQKTTAEVVADRLSGVPIAFSLVHPNAYMQLFFGLQYALLAAIGVAAAIAWTRRDRFDAAAVIAWLRNPDRLPWVFLVLFAAGGMVSMHLVHKDFGTEWHFGRRHALTAFFAFQLSWIFLMTSGGRARKLALALLAVSLLGGLTQMTRLTARAVTNVRVAPPRDTLMTMLESRATAEKPLTIAMSGEVQRFAMRTGDRVNYHWVHQGTRVEDLDVMFDALGAQMLLVQYETERVEWAFLGQDAFWERYVRVADVDGYWIFEKKPGYFAGT